MSNQINAGSSFREIAPHWPPSPSAGEDLIQFRMALPKCCVYPEHYLSIATFVYEFSTVAVTWSLMAVEAAFRDRLEMKESFATLIKTAEERGLLPSARATILDAGRKLRNRLVHADVRPVLTPAMAVELLAASHAAIADLYETF